MPNGSTGAGKRADYSDLADRQTRRRPGPSPSRWPRLIPSRIAPEILLCDSGPRQRQRACRASRPVQAYDRLSCRLMGSQKEAISAFGIHSGVIFIGRYCGRKVERGKRIYGDEERFEWSSGAANGPGVGYGSFLPPAPCLRTRAGGLFCETGTPPGRESHSMCAN